MTRRPLNIAAAGALTALVTLGPALTHVGATSAAAAGLPASQGSGSSPSVQYAVQTTALGLSFVSTQRPPLSPVTDGLINTSTAYAASAFDASGSQAQAAVLYPGQLVAQGPQLLCQEFLPCPVSPPSYPLLARASYPTHPRDTAADGGQTEGAGPVRVTPGTSLAQASAAGNSATTRATDTQILAGTAGFTTLGASTSTTTTRVAADGLHILLVSTANDITIADLVHIASVRVADDVLLVPGGRPIDDPTVTVSGVTAAGQGATIDNTGIHAAGQRSPSLAQALAAHGISLRLLGVSRSDSAGAVRTTGAGLEISFTATVSGVPAVPGGVPRPPCPPQDPFCLGYPDPNTTYVGDFTVASVGIAATAAPGFHFPFTLPATAPNALPGVLAPARATPGGSGGTTTVSFPAAGTSSAGGAPRVAGPRWIQRAFVDFVDLRRLYLVLAAGTIALFVGWRMLSRLGRWRQA